MNKSTQNINEFFVFKTAHRIYREKRKQGWEVKELLNKLKAACLDMLDDDADDVAQHLKIVKASCQTIETKWTVVRQSFQNDSFDHADMQCIHRGIELELLYQRAENRFSHLDLRTQRKVVSTLNMLNLLTDKISLPEFRRLVKDGNTYLIYNVRDNNRLFCFFMALLNKGWVDYEWKSKVCTHGRLLSKLGNTIVRHNVNSACNRISSQRDSKYRNLIDEYADLLK